MADTLHMESAKGARAERLLSDELVAEAFEAIERDYLDAWKKTGARDTEARERLWQAYQIAGKVRTHLLSVAANGKLAQKELEEIEALGERKKILGVF